MTQPSVAIIGTRGYPSFYGGFETAVRKLAPYLADNDWDVTVYGRPEQARPSRAIADSRITVRMTRGVESKQLSTLSYGLTATVDAARRRPDVALIMNVANGFWLPLLRARGIPTLVNVDGIEWERAKWGRLAKLMFKVGAKATARWATELVFDAEAIGERWRQDFSRSGTFIPYGGDSPSTLAPLKDGLKKRQYILFVARFVPENTVSEFFEAAKSLADSWDVVIVGSSGYGGPLDDRAEQLSQQHERIHWLGHLSDDNLLHSLWANAGVYFHGHSVGGTNPALVQAMAAGAPIVARDTVYNREVLGGSASFADATPESIRRSVKAMMMESDLEVESKRNQTRAAEHYSWSGVCKAYDHALRSLVGVETVGAS